MTREQYESLHLADLREIAKRRGMKKISMLKKGQLIEAMLELDAKEANAAGNENIDRKMSGAEDDRSGRDNAGAEEDRSRRENRGMEDVRTNRENREERENRTNHVNRGEETRGRRENGDAREGRGHRENGDARRHHAYAPNRRQEGSGDNHRTYIKGAAFEHKGKSYGQDKGFDSQSREADNAGMHKGMIEDAGESNTSANEPASMCSQDDPGEAASPEAAGETTGQDETKHEGESNHTKSLVEAGKQVNGILEVLQDGYGFLRSDNFLPGEDDVYVSPSQIRRFNMKTGDMVSGIKRDKAQGEKFGALLFVSSINGKSPEEIRLRTPFENMTPIFPNRRIVLERPDGSRATRIVDLISPIGYGQRGMIVSPPKAGKTTLLKDIAKSILTRTPDANLIILLIDERPEEVTDMKESVKGEHVDVIYSTFDELPEHHRRVSEMVIERAKRLVEQHEDVIILLDSITRLTRAYNVLVPQSGRTLSGGLDPNALYMPKRFFGAARNMREGGSLTILATALVDTGSKMDDVVYEEFKGTGNMELILDRRLQERRIFPAIDIVKSGTRRDDLLLDPREEKAVDIMRRRLNGLKPEDAVEQIINAFTYYSTNAEVVDAVLTKWK